MGNSEEKRSGLPEYENPPVSEVVCGVLFKPISQMLTPHIGLLWEKYRSEYPQCREVAPLEPVLEKFDEALSSSVQIELSTVPPLARIWFIHKTGNEIIQVQRDRFLYNWRKVDPQDKYPRYPEIKKRFRNHFASFQSFIEENHLGKLEPLQYEMTYVNRIPKGNGWERLGQIGQVFPDFVFKVHTDRFLQEPVDINWKTTFSLPEKMGRLHVVIRYVTERNTGQALILLELTARGIGSDKSLEGMERWFDLAREWIVSGFTDLTEEGLQRSIWKRK